MMGKTTRASAINDAGEKGVKTTARERPPLILSAPAPVKGCRSNGLGGARRFDVQSQVTQRSNGAPIHRPTVLYNLSTLSSFRTALSPLPYTPSRQQQWPTTSPPPMSLFADMDIHNGYLTMWVPGPYGG